MTFRVGLQALAGHVNRGLLADAGENVLQRTSRGIVVQHVVGCKQRHVGRDSQAIQPRQTAPVVAAIEQACRQPHAFGVTLLQTVQNLPRGCLLEAMRQRQDQQLPLAKFQEVIELEMTLALFDLVGLVAAFAAREQLAEPAVSGAVAWIDQNVRRATSKDEPRAVEKFWLVLDVGVIEFAISPYDTGERVVIGDANGGKPEPARLMHIFLRMRAAAQEREIRSDANLGIIDISHANNPCTNQLAGTGLPSWSRSSLS